MTTLSKSETELIRQQFGNKAWRMDNLYFIIDKAGKSIKFQMNSEQRQVWETCYDEGKLTTKPNILKARQLGITTFFVLTYFDDAIWNENFNCFIQSHEQESIKKIFRIVRYAYRYLPDQLKPALDKGGGSMYEYFFPDINSRIYVGLENRSSTIHRLHLSEAAFQSKDRIKASLGALPPGIPYSTETTPDGMNWYFDDWVAKKKTRKDFFFPWFMHSPYTLDTDTGPITADEKEYADRIEKTTSIKLTKGQMEFRRAKIDDLKGEAAFDQEFPSDDVSCFVGDISQKVIPEAINLDMWQGKLEKRPDYYDYYGYFDLGFNHYFFKVYGYLDFKTARLIIEKEYAEHYKSTGEHVTNMREIEFDLLDGHLIENVADSADPQLIYDMGTDHHYAVRGIVKKVKHGKKPWLASIINNLRVKIGDGSIVIDPEGCPKLTMQLKYGRWNEKRTDFEETEEMGHLDGIVSLAYFAYDIDWAKNPYGIGGLADKVVSHETHYITNPNARNMNPAHRNLVKMIGKK